MDLNFDKNLTIHLIEDENDTPESVEKFKKKVQKLSANEIKNGNLNSITIDATKSIKLKDAIEKFKEYKTDVEKVRQATLDNYKSAFNYLYLFASEDTNVKILNKRFFNELQIKFTKIPSNYLKKPAENREDIEVVISSDNNEDKLDNRTINKHFMVYSAFYDFLVRNDYLKVNPVDIKYLKEENETKKEEFEYQEIKDLFNIKSTGRAKDPDEEVHNIFKFAYLTGMRIGEILSLKIEDIEILDRTRIIDIKRAKNRTSIRLIPTNKDIDEILETQAKKSKNAYLFIDYHLKNRHSPKANPIGKRLNSRIKKYLKEKGKDTSVKSLHSFRKNFAQTLYLERFNIKEQTISKLMGHTTKDNITRKIYNRNKVEREALIRAMSCIKLSDIDELIKEDIYFEIAPLTKTEKAKKGISKISKMNVL